MPFDLTIRGHHDVHNRTDQHLLNAASHINASRHAFYRIQGGRVAKLQHRLHVAGEAMHN